MKKIDISYDGTMLKMDDTLDFENIYQVLDIIRLNYSSGLNILFIGKQKYDVILELQTLLHQVLMQHTL